MAPKQIQEFWLECQNDQSVPKGPGRGLGWGVLFSDVNTNIGRN